ncbi:Cation efflux family [Teratosphaeria destructans]|uniref:Zinc transporter n=1 Tax=Teratosphaeria destructans TaxID=418781 RepID=A0A9W7ST23_9PEZI|nr:Cation efflux family [Teratosphaeria destructans]
MASGYALPGHGGRQHSHVHDHGHSHSHTHTHSHSHSPYLSPNPDTPGANGYAFPPFPQQQQQQQQQQQHKHGGGGVKKAGSHGSLYTHAETSADTSPMRSPHDAHDQQPTTWHTPFDTNTGAFDHHTKHAHPNGSANGHRYTTPLPPMKSGRARGESDLGRPADPRSPLYRPSLGRVVSEGHFPPASAPWFSLPEALTALLIPLPYMLASAAYSSISGEELGGGTHPLPAYARLQHGGGGQTVRLPQRKFSSDSGAIEACTLTSGTLLLVGIVAKMTAERQLDRRKGSGLRVGDQAVKTLFSARSVREMALRSLSLGLPFYAAMQIGGLRTGLVLLATHAAGWTGADAGWRRSRFSQKPIPSAVSATTLVVGMSVALDFVGLTFQAPFTHMLSGYLALLVSVILLPLPLPALATGYRSTWSSTTSGQVAASPFTTSPADVNMTLVSGVVVSILTVAVSMLWDTAPPISSTAMAFSTLAIAAMCAAVFFAQPHTLRDSKYQAGLGLGCLVTACCAFLYSPSIWPGTVCNGGLSALSFLGVLFDASTAEGGQGHHHDHSHVHADTHHHHRDHHQQAAAPASHSRLTRFLLTHLEPGSLVHGILSEKDSRRIAYFTTLNFAFMFVQGVYGYLSGSLGLLSDTVHMFFDCLGLVVGLAAAVASKLPPTPEKPYGWGKLNTLAGFGNGVFLMLVSVEFVWEAIEGIVEHKELRHVQELLVVSVAGLLVNMVGLFAFGHAHAGHDHGHDHGHSHGGHDHGHGHNENMHGIFLHVAADAGGSLAVIISTGLTLWRPWYLWDPAATILIAILIFAAAVPLVISSGQKLLLVIPEAEEYGIKNVLQDLGELRGVVGYAVPRFWIDDADAGGHGHGHGHDHGCSHGHDHGHSHDHGQHSHDHAHHHHHQEHHDHARHDHDHHDHAHSHTHDHSHDHGHDHAHSQTHGHSHNHDHHDHAHSHTHDHAHHHDHHDHAHSHTLAHSHDHSHSHDHDHKSKDHEALPIKGVIHIIAAHTADPDDVLQRVTDFTRGKGMDLVIHVETEGDGPCWCGGAGARAHMRNGSIGGAALANMMKAGNGSLGGLRPKPQPLLKVG